MAKVFKASLLSIDIDLDDVWVPHEHLVSVCPILVWILCFRARIPHQNKSRIVGHVDSNGTTGRRWIVRVLDTIVSTMGYFWTRAHEGLYLIAVRLSYTPHTSAVKLQVPFVIIEPTTTPFAKIIVGVLVEYGREMRFSPEVTNLGLGWNGTIFGQWCWCRCWCLCWCRCRLWCRLRSGLWSRLSRRRWSRLWSCHVIFTPRWRCCWCGHFLATLPF